jgi:hypothetical protein
MEVERIKRYEAATVLEIELNQVPNDGCLARVLNATHRSIFLELTGLNLASAYQVRAERSGVFKYTSLLGATVNR